MICPECMENRYHHHSNLRPIEREEPVNIIEEAIGEFKGCWSGTTEDGVRAAITYAVRKCAEIVQENADSNTQAMLRAGIAHEILRAAGLSEEKKNG